MSELKAWFWRHDNTLYWQSISACEIECGWTCLALRFRRGGEQSRTNGHKLPLISLLNNNNSRNPPSAKTTFHQVPDIVLDKWVFKLLHVAGYWVLKVSSHLRFSNLIVDRLHQSLFLFVPQEKESHSQVGSLLGSQVLAKKSTEIKKSNFRLCYKLTVSFSNVVNCCNSIQRITHYISQLSQLLEASINYESTSGAKGSIKISEY